MNAEGSSGNGSAWRLLVAFSFVPLMVKAGTYVTLGSYAPLLVFCFFGGLVAWGARKGSRAESLAVRIWASAIIFWGLARLGVMGMLLVFPLNEAHVVGQFTAWYVLLSLGHLALGIYFFRHYRRVS